MYRRLDLDDPLEAIARLTTTTAADKNGPGATGNHPGAPGPVQPTPHSRIRLLPMVEHDRDRCSADAK